MYFIEMAKIKIIYFECVWIYDFFFFFYIKIDIFMRLNFNSQNDLSFTELTNNSFFNNSLKIL